MTLVGKKKFMDLQKNDDGHNPNIKSDYYNPLTNQAYKKQEQDNTLELLAIPSFNDLMIERKDSLLFAQSLL